MGIISSNKERLIRLLRYLNVKPGFRRVFYWIHEIRKDELHTDRFLAVLLDEGFYIGVYKHYASNLWRRLAEGTFEPEETRVLKKITPDFDYFIDIGAHIGYYSCLVGHLSPEKKIMSFEPNPHNYASLVKNLELNNLKKAKAYPIGLGEKKEGRILYGIDAMGSIVKETYGAGLPKDQVTVQIDTLDSFLKEVTGRAKVFIKADVEGNEYALLKGARQFITKVKPVGFILEICKQWSNGLNPHYDQTLALMKDFGYERYPIGGEDEGRFLFIRKDLARERGYYGI